MQAKHFQQAGLLAENCSAFISDDDLLNSIKVHSLILTYLKARPSFDLATTQIRRELEALKGFAENRGWKVVTEE